MTAKSAAPHEVETSRLKQCCANLYESDVARALLGESLHPGGLRLTERLAGMLNLGPASRVLDVAAGRGTSALHLAEWLGCDVTGIDYGEQNVAAANRIAASRGLEGRVRFLEADAERLPFADRSFDAVICECAFCTFPDKQASAAEFVRVLRAGGQVGLSDLTRNGPLRPELEDLLSWIACIADALPVADQAAILCRAGLVPRSVEQHDDALYDLVRQIRGRLLAAEIIVGLKKTPLPGFDFAAAKTFVVHALAAVDRRDLGYVLVTASRPV